MKQPYFSFKCWDCLKTFFQELGPESLALTESFAISDTMLSAPIALDWVQYNTYDNQGEVMTKAEWDEATG